MNSEQFFHFEIPSASATTAEDMSLMNLLNSSENSKATDVDFLPNIYDPLQTFHAPAFDASYFQQLHDQLLFQQSFVLPDVSPVMSTADIESLHQYERYSSVSPVFEERTLSNSSTPLQTPHMQFLDFTPPSSPTLQPVERRNSRGDNSKTRFKPNREQFDILMVLFQQNPFPIKAVRNKLAQDFECSEKQIRFWFQNRRATLKTNGIHVCKPKSADSQALPLRNRRTGGPLVQLSSESSYFFVEK
ncbi:hypothetical protein BDR26DRAFT_862603 [Obelidium mucronatum]|nr:hypothetical protein BDR26DRAFT_862603 [Obelidium mucronatum]